MKDAIVENIPESLEGIERDTEKDGFSMPSDRKVGSLLRTLAASKAGGRFLELGTGTGLSTSWLLAGMDQESHLDSVDNNAGVLKIAQRHLGDDKRVAFHCSDGEEFIAETTQASYDMIFADTWAGKYDVLDEALDLLTKGGLYVIDDMCPQSNWPAGHEEKVATLLQDLEDDPRLDVCRMTWATGVVLCTR